MYINVELPEPITIVDDQKLELFVGPGMDTVIVHGSGVIEFRGNGGNAPQYSIDLCDIARKIKNSVTKQT